MASSAAGMKDTHMGEEDDQGSDYDDSDLYPENKCCVCEQTFHEQDEDPGARTFPAFFKHMKHESYCQDAEGVVMYVVPSKSENRGFCQKCFYCKRGSFPDLKAGELLRLLRKSRPLHEKLLGMSMVCVCGM